MLAHMRSRIYYRRKQVLFLHSQFEPATDAATNIVVQSRKSTAEFDQFRGGQLLYIGTPLSKAQLLRCLGGALVALGSSLALGL